jgi:hypothetical protein
MKKRVRRKDIIYIRVASVEEIDFDNLVVREKLARTYANFLTIKNAEYNDSSPHYIGQDSSTAGGHNLP